MNTDKPTVSTQFQGHADDAVGIAPGFHTVLFEDDQVRVLKVTVPQGAAAAMHWHPRSLSYFLSPAKMRFTDSNGIAKDVELRAEQVTQSPERYHAVENVGNGTAENILIEFKQ